MKIINLIFSNYYFFFKKNFYYLFTFYLIFLLIVSWRLGIFIDYHRWYDGAEYVERARGIEFLNLNFKSLEDGFRPPLYPIVLKILNIIFPFNLTITAKIFNIFCLCFMPFILYLLSQKDKNRHIKQIYFIKINLLLFFLPNFYLADLVYAEVLTILIFNVFLFYILSSYLNDNFNLRIIFILSFLFVSLFYLKANLILLGLCFGLILFKKFKKNIKAFIYIGLLSSFLIFPWFIYMFNLTGQIKSANAQSVNRLYGMGLDVIYGQNINTIHGSFLIKAYKNSQEITEWFKYYRKNMNEEALLAIYGISLEQQLLREKLSRESIEKIWEYNKTIQIIYSFLKIPHVIGLNLRDTQDYSTFFYFLFVFGFGIAIIKTKSLKIFVYLNILVLVALLVQTFLYVPTLRYSIYLLNSSLLIMAGFFLYVINKNKNLIK